MESIETNQAQAEPSLAPIPVYKPKPRRKRVNLALASLLLSKGLSYDEIAPQVGAKTGNSLRVNLQSKGVCYRVANHPGLSQTLQDKASSNLIAGAEQALKSSLNARLIEAVDKLAEKNLTYADLANNGQGHASVLKTLAETHRAINGSSDQVQVTFGVSLVEDRELHAPVIDIN